MLSGCFSGEEVTVISQREKCMLQYRKSLIFLRGHILEKESCIYNFVTKNFCETSFFNKLLLAASFHI